MQVFKIQRPISTNEPSPLALAYNKDRSQQKQFRMTKDLFDFMGPEYKVYVEGRIVDGRFDFIKKKLPHPPW